jgi:hypothetical protein
MAAMVVTTLLISSVGTGPCIGLKANVNSNNVANDMMDDDSLTGL